MKDWKTAPLSHYLRLFRHLQQCHSISSFDALPSCDLWRGSVLLRSLFVVIEVTWPCPWSLVRIRLFIVVCCLVNALYGVIISYSIPSCIPQYSSQPADFCNLNSVPILILKHQHSAPYVITGIVAFTEFRNRLWTLVKTRQKTW